MKISVRNKCSDFKTYRASRVKSLFNVESGCDFSHDAEIPIDDGDWKIGLVVGPSGSGKTSIGRKIFGGEAKIYQPNDWPDELPIIDAIAPSENFDSVTAALASVGLGSVPSWLRPFRVLSNGEQFRANLARLICESPSEVVVDEFTSVVDRQIAKIGALAFQKSWRRTGGKCVLLSCHYDVIDWIEPDWIYDTAKGEYAGRRLWRRPKLELEIWQVDKSYWKMFEPHYYLKLPPMVAASYYVGFIGGEPVCHLAVSPSLHTGGARASRMVVMPEWQGAGVGLRFLSGVCDHYVSGKTKYGERVKCVFFHTSHPGLCAALRRANGWVQVSGTLNGANKSRSAASLRKSRGGAGKATGGFGGHFRAIQGFKYAGHK